MVFQDVFYKYVAYLLELVRLPEGLAHLINK